MKKTSSGISPIISIERDGPYPLHQQVYDAYRTAIIDRSLRAGQRVPSTRMLAGELGISRLPILNAYAQLLAEGYFESRVGAGTVISHSLPDQLTSTKLRTVPSSKRASPGPRLLSKRSSLLSPFNAPAWSRGWGAFGASQVAFEHFPFRIWNSLVTRHCRKLKAESLDYGSPMGSLDLREAIAAYVRTARGVRCEASQIIIVSGSQQGLEISTKVLLDPGSSIWMEEPGYRLARNVFAFNGCRIVPVPVDDSGLDVAAGIKQCPNARAVLVTPSHQYPLGVTMSASRRLQLLDWAERSGSWIIEDDYDSEYRYESLPIPSLQGLDSNARVIYIGTFSKVLFPSLRLGYIVLPPDLLERFLATRLAIDISPAGLYQAVLADFIREGHFARHIRRMRLLYGERRSVLIKNIREQLGPSAEIIGGQAGMHLSLVVGGIDDREITRRAAEERLWLTPLSACYLCEPGRQGFILGFGSTPVEQIPDAVLKLGALVKSNCDGRVSDTLAVIKPGKRSVNHGVRSRSYH